MWYWYELFTIGCITHTVIELIKKFYFNKEKK